MAKFLVEYKHVEETTYEEWVEAEAEDEALLKVEEDPNFDTVTGTQGIEMKDFNILDKQED